MSTYKGSVRDGKKYLTVDGKEPETLFNTWDWGWYGGATLATALWILRKEYGMNTADKYGEKLARQYLAACPEERFVLTSEQLAHYIKTYEDEKIEANNQR